MALVELVTRCFWPRLRGAECLQGRERGAASAASARSDLPRLF